MKKKNIQTNATARLIQYMFDMFVRARWLNKPKLSVKQH